MPSDAQLITLATPGHDIDATLDALCHAVGAQNASPAQVSLGSDFAGLPTGKPTPDNVGIVIASALPENAIVVDESVTSGRQFPKSMPLALPHDVIDITGGSIGFGLPAAVGASVACPDRRVVALIGDGSAMYTLQSLWTMARENLNVTVVIFSNRSYRILRGELNNMGGPAPGENARRMLDLDQPWLDWVSLAKGHGVPGVAVDSLEGLKTAMTRANQQQGPHLIELVMG